MVADPVAGAEVFVGGIVEHTPADTADVFAVGRCIVLDPAVPQGMLLPLHPWVKGFCGEHMAIMFRDQQALFYVRGHASLGLDTRVVTGVGEIIIGIHILDQMTLLDEPDTGGGSAGIKGLGHLIGPAVEIVKILTFIDPRAPEYDAGVVSVLHNHLPGVFNGLFLPTFIAHVLPAGNLCKYQQAQFIAFIDEMLALRVVRGPGDDTAQLLLQNPGILPLELFRNCVAHIRIALMSVQAPEEYLFSVEPEFIGEPFDGPEAEFDLLPVQHKAILFQFHHQCMPVRVVDAPFPHSGHRHFHDVIIGSLVQKNIALFIQHFHQEGAAFCLLRGDFQTDGFRGGCGDVKIGNIAFFPDIQPDLPVQSAIGQIVNDKAKRRHRRIFCGIQLHRQQVFAGADCFGDFHPECRVAAAVGGHFPAIDINCGNMCRAVKLQK